MCFVCDNPSLCSTLHSKQALQCPPTPRKKRLVQSILSNDDPAFFPLSSSIFGSNTCTTDGSIDNGMTEESFLKRLNRLPVMVLVLKPQNKACHGDAHPTEQKLSISDVVDAIPSLPFQVSGQAQPPLGNSSPFPKILPTFHRKSILPSFTARSTQPPLDRSSPDPERVSTLNRNAIVNSSIKAVSQCSQPLSSRSCSDPELFLASKRNAIISSTQPRTDRSSPYPEQFSTFNKNAILPLSVRTVSRSAQPRRGRSSSDPEQCLASKSNANVLSSANTIPQLSQTPLGRPRSDPEQFFASEKKSHVPSPGKEKAPPIRRTTICNLPGS